MLGKAGGRWQQSQEAPDYKRRRNSQGSPVRGCRMFSDGGFGRFQRVSHRNRLLVGDGAPAPGERFLPPRAGRLDSLSIVDDRLPTSYFIALVEGGLVFWGGFRVPRNLIR